MALIADDVDAAFDLADIFVAADVAFAERAGRDTLYDAEKLHHQQRREDGAEGGRLDGACVEVDVVDCGEVVFGPGVGKAGLSGNRTTILASSSGPTNLCWQRCAPSVASSTRAE